MSQNFAAGFFLQISAEILVPAETLFELKRIFFVVVVVIPQLTTGIKSGAMTVSLL